MAQREEQSIPELWEPFRGLRLPRWEELPDLELYMDQVLSLVARYLGSYPGFDERGLTASMVNNYVKMGAMPAPFKKRYTRSHLARLLVICVLKPILPIAGIRQLSEYLLSRGSEEEFYDGFCTQFEAAVDASVTAHASVDADDASHAVLQAALRAQAEQAIAMKLYTRAFPDQP